MSKEGVPAFVEKAAKIKSEVSKLVAKSPKVKIKAREWLSTAQYAERCGIASAAAQKRLARAFSAKYYDLPKLAETGDSLPVGGNGLIVRCVPNSKGNRKYEVLLSSLPDYEPRKSTVDESANDTDGFCNSISSFLEEIEIKIFCDWLTISQRHPELVGKKDLTGGLFLVLNNSGQLLHGFRSGDGQDKTDFLLASPKEDLQSIAYKYFQCEGSWDSRVFIRAIDGRVDLHGNIGKYGRPDNLFGYTLEECILIANNLLVQHGLPPFTGGEFIEPYFDLNDKLVKGYTGATFSRIDLTVNISFGHPNDTKEYLNWLSTQHISRMRNHVHPDGNTVEIGYNDGEVGKSKYIQMVAYNKAIEFQKHSTRHFKKLVRRASKGLIKLDLGSTNNYYENLQKYMNELGVARLELRLKRDYFHQHDDIRYLGALEKDFTRLNQIFIERWSTATRDFTMKDINQMDKLAQQVYALYIAGIDLTHYWSKATFYRKRNLLLPYGVDISQPYRGETTAPKLQGMRTLKVRALPMPDWYYLPPVSKKKDVA